MLSVGLSHLLSVGRIGCSQATPIALLPALILFSLVENAKLYKLKVFDYLKYVFDHISGAKTARDFEKLTPLYAQDHVSKLKDADQPSKEVACSVSDVQVAS